MYLCIGFTIWTNPNRSVLTVSSLNVLVTAGATEPYRKTSCAAQYTFGATFDFVCVAYTSHLESFRSRRVRPA